VLGYREKQGGGRGWINAGIYLMARSLIEEIRQGPVSLEREMLPRWLEHGKRVFAFCQPGTFLDIGTPASYAIAESVIPVIPEQA
jgi:NDP-sugar pyrophosphorylase family protein